MRTAARTNARTGLSPNPSSRCSSLLPETDRVAAYLRFLRLAAVRLDGLLIPRSQVRSLPGPSLREPAIRWGGEPGGARPHAGADPRAPAARRPPQRETPTGRGIPAAGGLGGPA